MIIVLGEESVVACWSFAALMNEEAEGSGRKNVYGAEKNIHWDIWRHWIGRAAEWAVADWLMIPRSTEHGTYKKSPDLGKGYATCLLYTSDAADE